MPGNNENAKVSKPSNIRRFFELFYMMFATIAALFFFQMAKETDEENSKLQEKLDKQLDETDNRCNVCMADTREVVVQPCGHVCLCRNCALKIMSDFDRKCPICRRKIKKIQNIYMS